MPRPLAHGRVNFLRPVRVKTINHSNLSCFIYHHSCDVYPQVLLNELSNIKICYQISFITKRHLVFWHLVWPYWSHSLGSWIEHFIVWSITHILTYYITLHHVTILFENKNNLRKVWAVIKQVINRNKNSKISDQFIINNKTETDPMMIAKGFNNYFANIGPTLASKINNDNVSHRDFISSDMNASLFLEPTNVTEIKLIIHELKEGASGRDGILPKHIKSVSDSIAYPLARVSNLSFEQGVFPEELKYALVTPIYKANDPMFFNNYRPISLLSVFSKILERLMYNRLVKFLNKHNLFNKFQFGFRNKHSTFMALIILLENLVKALDDGNCAVGIFLDFQKAFDTVDHCILLDKLHIYGIRGIAYDWFSSYLSNWFQSVLYNNSESDYKEIKCGVPQGSILGPLLFLIYINDLPSVSKFFLPILFADDTNLFCTGRHLGKFAWWSNLALVFLRPCSQGLRQLFLKVGMTIENNILKVLVEGYYAINKCQVWIREAFLGQISASPEATDGWHSRSRISGHYLWATYQLRPLCMVAFQCVGGSSGWLDFNSVQIRHFSNRAVKQTGPK